MPSGHGSLHSNFSLLKHSLTGLSHLKLTTLKSLILSRLSPRSEAHQGRGGRKSVRAEGGGWLQGTAPFSSRRRKLYTWTHRRWASIPRPVRAQARQSQWPSFIIGKVGVGGRGGVDLGGTGKDGKCDKNTLYEILRINSKFKNCWIFVALSPIFLCFRHFFSMLVVIHKANKKILKVCATLPDSWCFIK